MTLTFDALETEVRRVAAESPDFVYPSRDCYYGSNEEDVPCIFGKALINLGVEIVRDWEYNDIIFVLEDLNISVTDNQKVWAKTVQFKQDAGRSWGEAVRAAKERIS